MKTSRLKWYVKQTLPLSYWTKVERDDRLQVVIWRMWLGRCFDVTQFEVVA